MKSITFYHSNPYTNSQVKETFDFENKERNFEATKSTFIVYATGTDCDGFGSDEEYEFTSLEEAKKFASDCNEGSDGLYYCVETVEK